MVTFLVELSCLGNTVYNEMLICKFIITIEVTLRGEKNLDRGPGDRVYIINVLQGFCQNVNSFML